MSCRAFSTGIALLALGVAGYACGSSQDDDEWDGCLPNRSVECAGPDGCVGQQVCQPDGLTYGPCTCADGSSAPSDDDDDMAGTGGKGDTGGGGSAEAGASGGRTASSGGRSAEGSGGRGAAGDGDDSGSAGDSAGGSGSTSTGGRAPAEECDPVDMSDWSPPDYVPARSAQAVCSSSEIETFIGDCLLGTDCEPFEADGQKAECGECLWPSPTDDSDLGPTIELSPKPFYRWENNVAGCIELGGEAECAEKIQAAQVCAREACLASCSVSSAAFGDCVSRARQGTCAERESDAVCIMDAALAARCTASGFEAMALQLGEVFCGTGE